MNFRFKDHFSKDSSEYNKFRPKYPDKLFSYLSSIAKENKKAWDCATGTGQAAIFLSNYFSSVIATDASAEQLRNAEQKDGIIYQVATAENSNIEDESVDLITVAQALHWFDIDKFNDEANRVLKENGILAVWTYNLLSITESIDKEILYLYKNILGDYWPKERRQVETGYKDINLPFKEIQAPSFSMSAEWNLSQLIGYLYTWSAVKNYVRENSSNPVEEIHAKLADSWGEPEKLLTVQWPLSIRIWQKV